MQARRQLRPVECDFRIKLEHGLRARARSVWRRTRPSATRPGAHLPRRPTASTTRSQVLTLAVLHRLLLAVKFSAGGLFAITPLT